MVFAWIGTPAYAADMAQCAAWLQEDLIHCEDQLRPGSVFKKEVTKRVFQAFEECREGNLQSRADYVAWMKAHMPTIATETIEAMPEDLAQCDAWFYESIGWIERDLVRSSKGKSKARVMLIDAYKRCSAGDLKSREAYERWLRDQFYDLVFRRVDGN
jgi:hypothetical protein